MRVLRFTGLVLLTLFLAMAATAAPELLSCPGDVAEPNDSVATAYVVPCTPDPTVPVWPTCLNPSGDIDFFALDLTAGQALTIGQSGGDFFNGALSIYAPDGVTLLERRVYSDQTHDTVSTVVGSAGKYFVSLASPTGDTGQYGLAVRCHDPTTVPPPVTNTLRAVKSAGNVSLIWEKPADWNLDPPTSYDVWRAISTTNLYYEALGSVGSASYDAGPVETPPSLVYYRVRALNAIGPDGPPPAVVHFDLLPYAPTYLDKTQPVSGDPCAVPNLHPQLPFVVTISLTDRFALPLDGYAVEIDAWSGQPFGSTFCPAGADPWSVSGTTGTAGPGRMEGYFSTALLLPATSPNTVHFNASSPDFGKSDIEVQLRW